MSRLVVSSKPLSTEDKVWMDGLKINDSYTKLSCKFYDETHTLILGAAIISTPYPNFARVDGLYTTSYDVQHEFLQLLTTTYKQDVLTRLSRDAIETLNPRLAIKKQPGHEYDILTHLNYKIGKGLFGDAGEWYIYSLWSDICRDTTSLYAAPYATNTTNNC